MVSTLNIPRNEENSNSLNFLPAWRGIESETDFFVNQVGVSQVLACMDFRISFLFRINLGRKSFVLLFRDEKSASW
jgi:hypothetical protein